MHVLHFFLRMSNPRAPATRMSIGIGAKLYANIGMDFFSRVNSNGWVVPIGYKTIAIQRMRHENRVTRYPRQEGCCTAMHRAESEERALKECITLH
jgi:hypothetical protein